MCSGRVDLEFILRAFANGQDGVFIGGCRLNECNYITHGNYDALGNTLIVKKILEHLGLNPDRLKIEFMNASDGNLLAEVINDFCSEIRELGPLGQGEGLDIADLKFKLEAVKRLVPYMRLVERERLRVPTKSKEAFEEFFASQEADKLFQELILDKMVISQIMQLLKEKPLSTGDIAEKVGLNPSEVSKHMNTTSMHGLVRYDVDQKCFALA